jgi:hypothetical protein
MLNPKHTLKWTFLLVGLTTLVAAWAGAGLSWDGSYHLIQVLQKQSPYIVDARISIVPIHEILIFLSRITDNLALLRFVYSIAYTIVPLAALALCAATVIPGSDEKESGRSRLFFWAAFGILAAGLPGQFFFMSEANFSMSFFWPLLVLTLLGVPRPRWQLPVIGLLSLIILFGHPNAVILFTLLGAAALLHGGMARQQARQKRLGLALLGAFFLALGALSFVFIPAARQWEYSPITLLEFTAVTLLGWPVLYYLLIFLAALWSLWIALDGRIGGLKWLPGWAQRLPARLTPASRRVYFGLFAAAGACLGLWALNPAAWVNALGMRRLVHFLSLPIIACMLIDWFFDQRKPAEKPVAAQAPSPTPAQPPYQAAVLALALLFSGVLLLQTLTWVRLTGRLMNDLASQPQGCVSTAQLPWLGETAFKHWFTPSYVILMQGRRPTHLLMEGDGCAAFNAGKFVQTSPWDQFPFQGGWFDFTQVEKTAPQP